MLIHHHIIQVPDENMWGLNCCYLVQRKPRGMFGEPEANPQLLHMLIRSSVSFFMWRLMH